MSEDKRSFLTKLIQFFKPYYKPKPKRSQIQKDKDATFMDKALRRPPKKKVQKVTDDDVFESQDGDVLLRVLNFPKPLDNVMQFKKKPSPGNAWYYHDASRHQIVAHFKAGDGYRVTARDDAARKKLKPLLYPQQDKPFDRTHVLPMGYHGSENDPRLVVGWSSEQNRGPLNEFEQKIKKLTEDVYWFTDIRRSSTGATWRYVIISVKTGQLIDSIQVDMQNVRFKWDG